MDVKTLLEIIETRIKANDSNPTSGSFLFEVYKALERLDKYEEKEKSTKTDE